MARRPLLWTLTTALLVAGCASPLARPSAESAAPPAPTIAATAAPAARPAGQQSAPAPAAPAPAPPQGAAAAGAGAPRAAVQPPPPAPAPTAAPAPKPADNQAPSQTAQLPPVSVPSRMIIYNAELTLIVRGVDAALRSVSDVATQNGGYVAGVENGSDNGVPYSVVKLKVPPDRYQAAMNALHDRGLALEVRNEKATTQDVTEEYSDVQTQLESLEATHRQLLDLMAKATSMDDLLKIQQQDAQVKLQIDRLKGRATALERLSELATITVKLQSADAVLARDYVAVRTQLRQAQSQLAAQLVALKRARTPEEEAKIRDQLAELQVQIDRSSARLKDLEREAAQASVTLPTLPTETEAATTTDQDLADQYIASRIDLRRAEARQAEILRKLKLNPPVDEADALRKELSDRILQINVLNGKLKSIQDRASQTGVSLPTLTLDQEAALAGTTVDNPGPDPLRTIVNAWDASLAFLRTALAALLGVIVFLWWALPLVALAGYVARQVLLRRRAGRSAAPTVPPAVA